MDGLDWVSQQDFSGGAFLLQERVPSRAVEDLVNGLIDDDGSVFKRGGGVYKGAAFAGTVLSVWDAVLAGGQRTIVGAAGGFYDLGADDATPALLHAAGMVSPRRAALIAGMLAVPAKDPTDAKIYLFGGTRKADNASYSVGTITLTKGSTTVASVAGTSWLANVDAGMVLVVGSPVAAVASVESDTALTLATPYPFDSAANVPYSLDWQGFVTPAALPRTRRIYVASAANRLLAASGNLIAFSDPLAPGSLSVPTTNFHALPEGGSINGLQAFGDSVLVFTTQGIYRIANLAFDLTDALGNVQQMLSTQGHDVILWNDNGLVGIDGGVLIPAIDDLYVYSAGAIQPFSAPGMRKQWRQYVKAGYTLGNAAVHRGHYFLPILDSAGTTLVDVLVLRLDTGAWGRWSGHSAGVSFAQRGATSAVPPKLLAAKSTRLLDLTGTFEPAAGNKLDADGTTPQFQVTLRTVQRRTPKDLLMKLRVRAELDDAAADNPTMTAEMAVGRPGSAFTALAGSLVENDGQSPHTWSKIGRRGTEFRARLTSVGASARLVLRSVEYAFRPSGRQ